MQIFFKILRESYGITRSEFAKRVGLSGPFVGQIENGQRKKVSNSALKAISTVFGVAEQWLVDGSIDRNFAYAIDMAYVHKKDMTIAELAKKVSVPENFMEEVINKRIGPSYEMAKKIVENGFGYEFPDKILDKIDEHLVKLQEKKSNTVFVNNDGLVASELEIENSALRDELHEVYRIYSDVRVENAMLRKKMDRISTVTQQKELP